MQILALRLDAPLMSFGGVMVDQHGPTDRFPGLSLLAGLFANALGYRHADFEALEALQDRLEYAARWDVPPQSLVDYHTVDLNQPKMRFEGWTTRGRPEHRGGGPAAAFGTHPRYRHYLANGVMTAACSLRGEGAPSLADLAAALHQPARPLFLGRKTCLPAAPLFLSVFEAPDLLSGLQAVPAARRAGTPPASRMEACWPAYLGDPAGSRLVEIYDRRDWRNQTHAGRRTRREGILEVSP